MPETLQVTAAEAGQKLLQFLSRRFEEPQSVLHRWIRTGQVRINGGRAKPFDRVELNDEIRVPPFAGAGTKAERVPASSGGKELPPIVAETADVIVFCKPSGLPVHPGTGHTDSLTTRLEAAFAGSPFIPAPVHRLDRDTSGLLLVFRMRWRLMMGASPRTTLRGCRANARGAARNVLRIIWQNAQSAHRAAKRSLPGNPARVGPTRSPRA